MLQADRESLCERLRETEQQLEQAREDHERHLILEEATLKSREAAALQQKTEELAALKEALDKYVILPHPPNRM
jgi:hypothetical protein